METLLNFFEQKISPVFLKLANNDVMKSISSGFIAAAPLSIAGAFFQMIKSLPLGEGYTNFLINTGLDKFLNYPLAVTTNITALLLSFTIAYNYAKVKDREEKALTVAIVSVVAFLLVTPFTTTVQDAGGADVIVNDVIPTMWLGAQGIFVSMLIAIVSSKIFLFVVDKGWVIKMPDGVPANIATSFEGLVPGLVILIIFVTVRVGLEQTPFGSLHTLIFGLLQVPLQNLTTNIYSYIIVITLMQLLWLVGVHGPMVVFSVMMPVWQAAAVENAQLVAAGQEATNIISTNFYIMLNSFGGSGYTLPLVIMMMFIAKSDALKTLGKLSIVPGIFNINEPVIFGLPMVMNPMTAIPFVITPAIVAILAYILTKVGFLSVLYLGGPTQVPIIAKAFMFGGSGAINWAIFHVLAFIISALIWYPFFKMLDKQYYNEEQENINEEVEVA